MEAAEMRMVRKFKQQKPRYFPQVACSPRIRGRQAFADLLVQMIRDREKELAVVLDRHSVSKFTHRGRIQSTLRIRCYERCIAIQDRHRCKPSSAGSDLNRSPRGSGVMHLLREKYQENSENIDTGASSSTVSSRGRILDKDPHKATEKKILQETIEKSDLKEIKEVISSAENVKKPVLSEIAENKNGLKKYSGDTIKKETAERRETNEKVVAKESLEGKCEKRELTKEKAIAKENVEGNALIGIAEKVNLWNSEEKMNRRKGMEKVKVEGKYNTERVDVLEEATRRMVNVESAERSITSSKETMARCEFVEKVVRRKNKEDCVFVETKSKEINPQEGIAQAEEKVLQETTVNSVLKKPIEKESSEGREEMREVEESVEINTLMGIVEKVNMWNSKENKNRRRVMEKGKGRIQGKANMETNEVLQEASRRISNVETAERSIASSKETVVEKEEIMDKREISRETTRSESAEKQKIKKEEDFASVETKCKEIIEDKNVNPQVDKSMIHGSIERNKEKNSSQEDEEILILRNSEAKSTKEIDRNNSQEVTQKEESTSDGPREMAEEKNSSHQGQEKYILRNPNDENGMKELEDEEIKKVEHEEKEENVKEVAAVEFVNDWEENEMEEEEDDEYYGEYDHYNGENMDDWIHDISRPRSYWEDLRKERYLEVLNVASEKKDICNLIERRTVSNFLTSDLRQKIDNLMITRVHGHVGVPINQVEEEEWEVECSARNQEDNETDEEEGEKTNLEAVSDVCSQSSERSTMLMSWSFRDQEIDKDQEPTTSLCIPEPSVPTNQYTQETLVISELRGQMEQLQREMLELRNSVKSCIDMQLHFQKSVTQDLSRSGSSAEQLVETKPDPLKRKCCVCSEMPVDSLLYRCGHMCTCLKCAHELQWSSKKCPICMAPIVDVVRAFLDS
ncbi:putative E3 ubiquitin-protein ligase LUL3 [Cardamine amara subsp. amara]|uniref:E3 ubiquitin-protein ligase LUL3 n=1 Tax=Cardamine amara subsp. amara TaxID=228776 RepID=A0ABD1AMC9_CARAN